MTEAAAATANDTNAELAPPAPPRAPTLARIERMLAQPVDPARVRAWCGTPEVAQVQTLGAEVAPVLTREPGEYYSVSVGAGPASYEHRGELKALHLRWDPNAREWSGVVLGSDIPSLESLGLVVMVRSGAEPSRRRGHVPDSSPAGLAGAESSFGNRAPVSRLVSRRRVPSAKASVEAYGAPGVQGRESARFSLSDSPGGVGRVLAENRRAFSALDVTAGLPDDSREDDQRVRAQVERERQGRVAAAQDALRAHPEARELVMRDQTRLRMFCARFSVMPVDICPYAGESTPVGSRCGWCRGVHGAFRPIHVDDLSEVLTSPADWLSEIRAREAAVLPGPEG